MRENLNLQSTNIFNKNLDLFVNHLDMFLKKQNLKLCLH